MQPSQLNPNGDRDYYNPALSSAIERNIRTIIHRCTKDAKDRSPQSQIADAITFFSGRMMFVYVHIAWFGLWILLNNGQFGDKFFDPFPYGPPTMVVSLEAIFLSTFLLISQNCMGEEMETRPEDVLAEIHRLQAIESSKR